MAHEGVAAKVNTFLRRVARVSTVLCSCSPAPVSFDILYKLSQYVNDGANSLSCLGRSASTLV